MHWLLRSKKIFVKIGLNDVIHPRTNSMKDKVPLKTAEEIIEGYQKLIDLARKENLKIYFFSRTAWKGYSRNFALTSSNKPDVVWSQEADDILNELNIWLQYKADIDGYIDLDFLRDQAILLNFLLIIQRTEHIFRNLEQDYWQMQYLRDI